MGGNAALALGAGLVPQGRVEGQQVFRRMVLAVPDEAEARAFRDAEDEAGQRLKLEVLRDVEEVHRRVHALLGHPARHAQEELFHLDELLVGELCLVPAYDEGPHLFYADRVDDRFDSVACHIFLLFDESSS